MNIKDIKLVVSDLDGTFLRSDKTVSKANQETLKKLKELNVPFAIASGRPLKAITFNIKNWQIEDDVRYIIYGNGYGLYDLKENKDHTSYPMLKEWNMLILKDALSLGLNAVDYGGDHIEALKEDTVTKRVETYNGYKTELVKEDYFYKDFFKFMISGNKEKLDDFERYYLPKYQDMPFHGYRSNIDIIEFNDKRVSKYSMLENLCQILSISTDEVLGFGDGNNDIELLKRLKYGVAMKNASDLLKKQVKYISKSNDDDGFSDFIGRLIDGKENIERI